MNLQQMAYVTYTAYEPGTSNVLSEGTLTVPTTNCWVAEQTVKAMFSSLEVCIRHSHLGSV